MIEQELEVFPPLLRPYAASLLQERDMYRALANDRQQDLENVYRERDKLHDAIRTHKERWVERNEPPAIWDATLWHAIGLWPEPEKSADF